MGWFSKTEQWEETFRINARSRGGRGDSAEAGLNDLVHNEFLNLTYV
jgi:hypothetical protein